MVCWWCSIAFIRAGVWFIGTVNTFWWFVPINKCITPPVLWKVILLDVLWLVVRNVALYIQTQFMNCSLYLISKMPPPSNLIYTSLPIHLSGTPALNSLVSSASAYGLINLPGKHSLFISLSVEIPTNVNSDHKPETSNFYVSAAGCFSCSYKCHDFWNLMLHPPVLETGVLFPLQGECPNFPAEQIQLICFPRHFVVTRLETAQGRYAEVLCYSVGSSADASAGTLVVAGTWITAWGGDRGKCFSVLPSSPCVTQPRGNTSLSKGAQTSMLCFSLKQFPFSVPPFFTPIWFWGRSVFLTPVCTVPSTKALCSLLVPLGTALICIKRYKVYINLFCNLSCTMNCMCQTVQCSGVSNTWWYTVKDSLWFCDL